MSLTISSNGLSSSPFDASGFFSAAFGAGLGRGFEVSRWAPLSATISAGRARLAISSKANILSLVVWFMVTPKVEDTSSVLPKRGQFDELSEIQFSRSRRRREIARTVACGYAVVHNFGAQRERQRRQREVIGYRRSLHNARAIDGPEISPDTRELNVQ